MPFAFQTAPQPTPDAEKTCLRVIPNNLGAAPPIAIDSDKYQIIVKSFRRFDLLLRFVRSVKKHYPTARILVADDSFEEASDSLPWEIREVQQTPGVSWLQFPFDTGLAACRNRLVKVTQARYVVNCDDDFVFTDETRLDKMVDVLDADADVDLCGGIIRENGVARNWAGEFSRGPSQIKGKDILRVKPLSSPWRRQKGTHYRKSELVYNFFMARRETLVKCPWDDAFKISGEHLDHFLSAHEKGIHVVYTPESLIDHRPAGSQNYRQYRQRGEHYNRVLREKWGIVRNPGHRAANEPGLPSRVDKLEALEFRKPNIIILGVGHSNTSITTRQIAALGWNLGDADQEYAESVGVRAVNQNGFDIDSAKIALEKLPQPWVVKDPRFARTLSHWIPAFAPYRPLLAWITKDLAVVKKSYRTRGETDARVDELFANCQKHFDAWPWPKAQVRAEDVAAAVAMFRQLS